MKQGWIIVAVVVVAYATAFAGVFQYDDYNVIVHNSAVHSWSGWIHDLGGIRPVWKLANTANWTSGLGVFGFHLVNLAIHAANAVMVWKLCARFVDRRIALVAALVFAVHPLQTEAVTYISGRATSLMTLFYLASVLAYLRRTPVWSYVVSPLLFACAFLTKEVAVTLPLALVLCDRRFARDQLVHWGVLVATGAVLVAMPSYRGSLGYSFDVRSVHDTVLSNIDGVWYLLERIVWPWHLNIDPSLPTVTGWSIALVAKAAMIAALFFAGVANWRRRPWLAFGVLWFFLNVAPTSSIVPRRDIVSEREVYLAAIGIYMIFAVAMWRFRRALIVLLFAYAARTTLRNLDYRSEVALWQAAVAGAPSARAYNNLGFAYELAGDPDAARLAYAAAVQLDPEDAIARGNLGDLAP